MALKGPGKAAQKRPTHFTDFYMVHVLLANLFICIPFDMWRNRNSGWPRGARFCNPLESGRPPIRSSQLCKARLVAETNDVLAHGPQYEVWKLLRLRHVSDTKEKEYAAWGV